MTVMNINPETTPLGEEVLGLDERAGQAICPENISLLDEFLQEMYVADRFGGLTRRETARRRVERALLALAPDLLGALANLNVCRTRVMMLEDEVDRLSGGRTADGESRAPRHPATREEGDS